MYKPLEVNIDGDTWKIIVLTKKQFIKQEGDTTKAVVYPFDRKVYFNDEEFHLFRIGHEIFHAFFNYLYLDDVKKMTVDDFEEVMANFLSEKVDSYITTRDLIFKHFNKQIKKSRRSHGKKSS